MSYTSRRWLFRLLIVAAMGGLFYRYPLFRVVRLDEAKQRREEQAFHPDQFARQFWSERLLKSLDSAADAETLVSAIRQDPATARERYGRSLGIGSVYCYFLRGKGTIVAIEETSVALCLSTTADSIDISIQTGLIFGNAIRDGSGLIDVNQFPNSQDFNKISEEINHLVETEVLPGFREEAKMGAEIEFVGCAEVISESTDLDPLSVVPIRIEVP